MLVLANHLSVPANSTQTLLQKLNFTKPTISYLLYFKLCPCCDHIAPILKSLNLNRDFYNRISYCETDNKCTIVKCIGGRKKGKDHAKGSNNFTCTLQNNN